MAGRSKLVSITERASWCWPSTRVQSSMKPLCDCTGLLTSGHWISRGSNQQPRVKVPRGRKQELPGLKTRAGEFHHIRSKQSQASLNAGGRKCTPPLDVYREGRN